MSYLKININAESEQILNKNIIGYDPSSLPPTKEGLLQQVKRTLYFSSKWSNAHMQSPTENARKLWVDESDNIHENETSKEDEDN
ncbi:hypothetical protein HHI36_003440 [Cryptolaemus montrouzieri]|uniref:Uncharacterized protein n=1 Tax=Cryptolaemus montrouzieri TaxID=559131 RepID=A0ABD2PDF4_9CUCU